MKTVETLRELAKVAAESVTMAQTICVLGYTPVFRTMVAREMIGEMPIWSYDKQLEASKSSLPYLALYGPWYHRLVGLSDFEGIVKTFALDWTEFDKVLVYPETYEVLSSNPNFGAWRDSLEAQGIELVAAEYELITI